MRPVSFASTSAALLLGAFASLAALPAAHAIDAPAGTVQPRNDPAATRELEGYLGGLKSFQGRFQQTLRDSNARVRQEVSGQLFIQKPGKFRWEYAKPDEQLIVSDGRNLWLYDADLEQVTVKPLDASLATTPALLLAGQAGIAESFAVGTPVTKDGLKWFELVPLRQDTDFTQLRLGFAAGASGGKSLELSAMELKDKLNQHTSIRFSQTKRNTSLAGTLFSFTPPKGVDVIGTPQR